MGQKAEKYRFQSIAKRLPLMFSIGYLVLLTFVGVITYFREERRMIEEYRRMADSSKGEGPGTVFKMADEIMYANKKAFKKKNGSYR